MANAEQRAHETGTTGVDVFATASDRMKVFIVGCQPSEAVLDAEQAIGTWPQDRYPEAYDVAVDSFKYRFGNEQIPDKALSKLIYLGTVKAVDALEIDPRSKKLRLPERFMELDQTVLQPVMGYYVKAN